MSILLIFFLIFSVILITDLNSMKKAGHKKEIAPYILLMLTAGLLGFLYLSDPNRESISALFFRILKIKP